jgi:hypothetical protein
MDFNRGFAAVPSMVVNASNIVARSMDFLSPPKKQKPFTQNVAPVPLYVEPLIRLPVTGDHYWMTELTDVAFGMSLKILRGTHMIISNKQTNKQKQTTEHNTTELVYS